MAFPTGYDDWFTKAGKFFHAANQVVTALGTTVPDELEDALQEFDSGDSREDYGAIEGSASALANLQSAGAAFHRALLPAVLGQLLVERVRTQNQRIDDKVSTALAELYQSMVDESATIEAPVVSTTTTAGGSNTGTGSIRNQAKLTDGRTNQIAIPETVRATWNGTGFDLLGVERQSDLLAVDWPQGSEARLVLTPPSDGGLVTNGTFDDQDAQQADLPDGWTIAVGTAGTSITLGDVEVQTVAISGTPTGGYYVLKWTDSKGETHHTAPLAYDATSATVLAALQALPELGAISVAQSGTSPNYTHTITFTGARNPVQLASDDFLTGGSPAITHATTTAGDANTARTPRALHFVGDGAELTGVQRTISLEPSTGYALAILLNMSAAPLTGVLEIALVDGVGGTVVQDDQGANLSFAVDLTAVSAWTLTTAEIVTPKELPLQTYIRAKLTTALETARTLHIDYLACVRTTAWYTNGPASAAFHGATDFVIGDYFDLAYNNDRGGGFLDWINRTFDLLALGIQLPTSGSPSIPDSRIG